VWKRHPAALCVRGARPAARCACRVSPKLHEAREVELQKGVAVCQERWEKRGLGVEAASCRFVRKRREACGSLRVSGITQTSRSARSGAAEGLGGWSCGGSARERRAPARHAAGGGRGLPGGTGGAGPLPLPTRRRLFVSEERGVTGFAVVQPARRGLPGQAASWRARAAGSRMRAMEPSPRIAPPAIPGSLPRTSPRLLITTSCLLIISSTMIA
jgi:hypothetical protein